MSNPKPFPVAIRVVPVKKPKYSGLKCPGYCCSYSEIEVTRRDIARLARHFGIGYEQAEARYTKLEVKRGIRMMRHRKDHIYDSMCMLFDQDKRRCTVYEARPAVCRAYPEDTGRCGYYDFLSFEREQQGDPDYVALT
jgi:Fe-S-cluster containining protein